MRNLLTLTFLLLTCGFWAFAQQSYPSQSSQSSQSQASNSNQTSVKGCLGSSGGNYTLTSDSGAKYQLAGDTSKLSDHVGHEVEITGTTSSASSASSMSGSTSNPSAGRSEQTLNVSKVKHIASTCNSSSTMQH